MASHDEFEGLNHPWRLQTPDLRIPFDPPFEAWESSLDHSWLPYFPFDPQKEMQPTSESDRQYDINTSLEQYTSPPEPLQSMCHPKKQKNRQPTAQVETIRKETFPPGSLESTAEDTSKLAVYGKSPGVSTYSTAIPAPKRGAIRSIRKTKHYKPYYFSSQEEVIYVQPSQITLTQALAQNRIDGPPTTLR